MRGYIQLTINAGLLIIMVHLSAAAKTCPTQEVKGLKYWMDYGGLYDVMDGRACSGRIVYVKRTNSSSKLYMYYGQPDYSRYGWLIGPVICSEGDGYVYGRNNHKRPDYMVRTWMERNDRYNWVYNFELSVKCTEGLTFAGMIGVVVCCVILLPILLIVIFCLVQRAKLRKKNSAAASRHRQESNRTPTRSNQPPGNRRRSSANPDGSRRTHQPPIVDTESGNINTVFMPDLDICLPPYTLEPPPYEEFLPNVNITSDSTANVGEVIIDTQKLPTYEQAVVDGAQKHDCDNNET